MLYKQFLTPFRGGIWYHRLVSVGGRGSFPHNPETVEDRPPIVLLLVSARIAIAVGILWCYVYDARPITNGSLLQNVYDARPITNGSLLRRLANCRTSVGHDYETSDRRNIVVHDNYRACYSVV